MSVRPTPLLLRPFRAVATGVLALAILFEEWGWEPLQRLAARVMRLPLLRQVEAGVKRLSPPAALAVLVVPSTLLLPVKLGAVWLVGAGHVAMGVGLILAAKVLGTALVARLFTLTRPALMRMPWFERTYALWTAWKDALLARVRASAPWRLGRVLKRRWRRRWARLRSRLMGE